MMTKRSFEQLSLDAVGVQSRSSRFRERHDEDRPGIDAAPVSQWRCNLTGMSQVYNLFFVAYVDCIWVYEPTYPSQALPSKPVLTIRPPPTALGLRGWMDELNPRAINNVIVQSLGNEEVIAVVRDDGDVDVHLIRHIAQAIERRAEPESTLCVHAHELRPLFQSNVGNSAWGLAIHSEARMLAVSANNHNVTVFKFGLISGEQKAYPPDSDLDGRSMDVTNQVLNGDTNIPNIAFCNTGDDPEGRWLLTTDISGFCRSIDLCKMQTEQTFRFGCQTGVYFRPKFDRLNAGWSIMFLNRKSFIEEEEFEAAVGLAPGEALTGIRDDKTIWDIGATVGHIANCREKFPGRKLPQRHIESEAELVIESENASTARLLENTTNGPLNDAREVQVTWPQGGNESAANVEEAMSDSTESTYVSDVDEDYDGGGDSSYRAVYGGTRICGNALQMQHASKKLCGDLPCPILHSSVRSCYLLQPSSEARASVMMESPMVGFTNILRQRVVAQFAWLNLFERLNLNAYIPAIGVVVLASQKGRAVVLSLTKLGKTALYPTEMRAPSQSREKTTYAMRIEHILPLGRQEEDLERPFAPLLGIATGPIQGTEHLPDEKKRWRLMMTYADHTILSYEIARRRARDSFINLQSMII